VAGDAATARDAERAAQDAVLGVGDRVRHIVYRQVGEIVRVYAKSYRVRWLDAPAYFGIASTVDKLAVRALPAEEAPSC
jgi:hypothetical protein